jgi:hypothetical protein
MLELAYLIPLLCLLFCKLIKDSMCTIVFVHSILGSSYFISSCWTSWSLLYLRIYPMVLYLTLKNKLYTAWTLDMKYFDFAWLWNETFFTEINIFSLCVMLVLHEALLLFFQPHFFFSIMSVCLCNIEHWCIESVFVAVFWTEFCPRRKQDVTITAPICGPLCTLRRWKDIADSTSTKLKANITRTFTLRNLL